MRKNKRRGEREKTFVKQIYPRREQKERKKYRK
jgi:hypothetical protein